jgi:hypothetical protein
MESIKEKLNKREIEINLYEKKFNFFNNTPIMPENKIKNCLINPNINYKYEEYLVSYNINNNNNHKLLKYELAEYDFNNNNNDIIEIKDITELKNKLNYLLYRYSFLAKDFLEDKWILYDHKNPNKYELEDKQFIFDNSILISDKTNKDFILYIKQIMNLCKILAKKVGYTVHTKFYNDEYHEICWLIFIFSEKKKQE